ncbi:MAG TPA: hypothetical protein VGN82_22520 [Bosea sp. (in: a-proteobacteria)]|jgi:hypothetical protein|uniref:hypothetical protein n=1 Tax=Bosea sp. (in: a-proteobacteria) TaxID=1871050 RepID=UPI002E128B78|nr:hypothetical protein [Bosea sp. (in: a-proteobacteria)]
MQLTHGGCSFSVPLRHKRAANEADILASSLGYFVMLLSFIIARLKAKPAYVWKPALTLTDSRIVSELTGAAN